VTRWTEEQFKSVLMKGVITRQQAIDRERIIPEGKLRIKPRWSCLRHHEHRWYWTAWLCIALRGGESK